MQLLKQVLQMLCHLAGYRMLSRTQELLSRFPQRQTDREANYIKVLQNTWWAWELSCKFVQPSVNAIEKQSIPWWKHVRCTWRLFKKWTMPSLYTSSPCLGNFSIATFPFPGLICFVRWRLWVSDALCEECRHIPLTENIFIMRCLGNAIDIQRGLHNTCLLNGVAL